jgi:class 3 adenylate cyclase
MLPAIRTRDLAAIMFSDIEGYTAMMGRDEQKGGACVARNCLSFCSDLMAECAARSVKLLSSFRSAVDAVNCACPLQTYSPYPFHNLCRIMSFLVHKRAEAARYRPVKYV